MSCAFPVLRAAGIGGLFGALPGTGPSIGAFLSYAVEKRISRDPGSFGKGAVIGVAAPESANNAAAQTAFIPTLTLGIPGSASMAVMMGALIIHGVAPGPGLMRDNPEIFWGLAMSFWVGNVLLLILNLPLIGIWVRMLQIPYRFLFPTIICLIGIGVYSVNASTVDIYLLILFGFAGYLLRMMGFELAPLLIGFILGPMVEENLRRAMLIYHGDFVRILQRPIAGTLIALTVLLLVWSVWSMFAARRRRAGASAVEEVLHEE